MKRSGINREVAFAGKRVKQKVVFALTLGSHPQQRANGVRHFATLTNHAAHVVLGHTQLKANTIAATERADFHLLGVIHQRLGNELDQFLHHDSTADSAEAAPCST